MVKNLQINGSLGHKRYGLTRQIMAVALAASMMLGASSTAYAAVRPENILGDAQIAEDRTEQKQIDAEIIDKKFTEEVTVEQIEKCVEMSDRLNYYYPVEFDYINTSTAEIEELDVEATYQEFLERRSKSFANRNVEQEAAIDAYCTFGTQTVCTGINASIINRLNELFALNGYSALHVDFVNINYETASIEAVMQNEDGSYHVFQLNGDIVLDIVTTEQFLLDRYNRAIANISGQSPEFDNNLVYNGVNAEDGTSVYLSIGDDELKTVLREGIALYKEVGNIEGLAFGNMEVLSDNCTMMNVSRVAPEYTLN